MTSYIVIAIIVISVIAYLKSPAAKGRRSERAVARKLNIGNIFRNGKTLTNIYIPKGNGATTEIDVLYITAKGLFVIENKNYAGYIFGNESDKNWTVTLYAGKSWFGGKKVEKHQFYNPIWQNHTHIKYLKSYLNSEVKAFSLITFSDRGDLKDITVNSRNVYVCNHSGLSGVIREIWNTSPDIWDDSQIEDIYKRLRQLTNVSNATKQAHVNNINNRFKSTDICPVCGGKLVLRTAKNGANAGNKFYGCSNYPKCKYIRNV